LYFDWGSVDYHYPPLEEVWMEPEAILDRVWVHLNQLTVNPDTVLYFYSALELRFFIEALYFRLLLAARKGAPARRDMKAYRPLEFVTLLAEAEPDWLASVAPTAGVRLTAGDLIRVNEIYGKLGAYLHLRREPYFLEDQAEWLLGLETLVGDAFEYLHRLVAGYTYPGEHPDGEK
jgi:hypothetical protein